MDRERRTSEESTGVPHRGRIACLGDQRVLVWSDCCRCRSKVAIVGSNLGHGGPSALQFGVYIARRFESRHGTGAS
jgi:hypothetical protein